MELSKEQLNELYKKLPPEMRSVEFTERTSGAIQKLADTNKFSPEQTRMFAETVWKTIIGALPKEKLSDELVAALFLPPGEARKVAGDIEKEIFANTPSLSRPLLKGEYPKRSEGEGVSATEKTPLRLADSAPPLSKRAGGATENPPPTPSFIKEGERGGGFNQPRPVPITKVPTPPPRQISGQAPADYSLQTILSDIRRGTAYDEKRISDAFHKTPIEVRQTLESVGFLSRLENIAKKFGLNVEETGELVSESGLVMLGLTLPTQFVNNLAKRLRLPRDRAMAVGQSVNMEVLRPVREALRKMGQPQPANPTPSQPKEGSLRFAPSVTTSSPSRPYPKGEYPKRSEGEGVPTAEIKQPLRPALSGESAGHLPFQKGQEGAKNIYSTDPYREPIE